MLGEREPTIIEQRPIPCIVEPPTSKLIAIDYKRDIYPYLGHEVHCVFCLKINRSMKNGIITREHLVPREAKKMYPESLGLLVDSRWNHIRICAPSHSLIDSGEPGKGKSGKGGKIYTLRNYGMAALVEFLAQYPRAVDPVYNHRQRLQFINLFGFLAERLQLQIDLSRQEVIFTKDQFLERFDENILNVALASQMSHATNTIDDFDQAGELVEFYMHEWQTKGNFDNQFLKAA
jgi:hypothetical protein